MKESMFSSVQTFDGKLYFWIPFNFYASIETSFFFELSFSHSFLLPFCLPLDITSRIMNMDSKL